jgi:glutaredoxin 2
MSEVHFCDLCDCIIKPGERQFYTVTAEKEYKNIKTSEDYTKHYENTLKNTKEICKTCNDLINNIFKLRYDSINNIAKELSKQYKNE